jgi:two-component system chemotaxis sensor kinase CheA
MIDVNTELSRKEIFELVFLSGFSTKEEVTDVSGRGVGMDVVKKKIGEIRGEVTLDSEIGKGTTLTLELPMTLSIIDGLLVKVASNQYVIPIANIEKIYALDSVSFGKTFNHVVNIDNEQYPYIDLRESFETEIKDKGTEQLILVKYEDRRVGLLVDQVIGEYQTVVKPLGRFLKKQENLSGASIMGDGTIAMVIDTNRLIHNNAIKKYRTNKQ